MLSRFPFLGWIALVSSVVASDPLSADCLVDQVQDSWNSTSGGFRWQSFVAGDAGFLCQVDVNTDATQADVTLAVYEGEGTVGALLLQQVFDLQGDVTSIELDNPIEVNGGSTYTLHFEEIPSWRLQTGDPYAQGVGNINPDVDFWFRTYLDRPVPTGTTSWAGVKAVFR